MEAVDFVTSRAVLLGEQKVHSGTHAKVPGSLAILTFNVHQTFLGA